MEMNSSLPAAKRVRAKKSAAATAPLAASKPKRKPKVAAAPAQPSEDLPQMIAIAAYYLAAKRNFSPGHEMEDWLAAEKQVLGLSR